MSGFIETVSFRKTNKYQNVPERLRLNRLFVHIVIFFCIYSGVAVQCWIISCILIVMPIYPYRITVADLGPPGPKFLHFRAVFG